jgi:hypothetical protein
MMHCIASVARAEGLAGLYKGFGPNLAKTAPCAALSWLVYESAKVRMGCPDVVHACAGGNGFAAASSGGGRGGGVG